jgi:hypothetical protein
VRRVLGVFELGCANKYLTNVQKKRLILRTGMRGPTEFIGGFKEARIGHP